MGKYKLWELAKSRDEVHILAQQVVEDWEGENKATRGNWDEEAVALAYTVHQAFWGQARPDVTQPPYTHSVHGLNVLQVLRTAVPGIDQAFSKTALNSIIRGLYASLASAQLLIRVGGSGGSTSYFIREWPPGFNLDWASYRYAHYIPIKDRPDLERQDRKAVVVASKVEEYTDIRTIPTPDPDPDSVMAYVKLLLAASVRLQTENKELRQKISELDSSRWQSVTDEIKQRLAE